MNEIWNRVAIAIPTMPVRRTMLGELLTRLRAECEGAEFVVREHRHGDPPRVDFPAVIDLALATRREWVLQIEDDAWPAPDFGRLARSAIRAAEDLRFGAVTLFSRSRRDLTMLADGHRWRTQAPSSFCMMQAVAVRATVLCGFVEWAPNWYDEHPEHVHAADTLLGAWLSRRNVTLFAHIPSLVQHRRSPSTLPKRSGARQSESYRLAFGEVP